MYEWHTFYVCICMYVCMCARVSVCMYVCTCMYVCQIANKQLSTAEFLCFEGTDRIQQVTYIHSSVSHMHIYIPTYYTHAYTYLRTYAHNMCIYMWIND